RAALGAVQGHFGRATAAALQRRIGPVGAAAFDARSSHDPQRAAAAIPATPAHGEIPSTGLRSPAKKPGEYRVIAGRPAQPVQRDAEIRSTIGPLLARGASLPGLRAARRLALGTATETCDLHAGAWRRSSLASDRYRHVRAAGTGDVHGTVP